MLYYFFLCDKRFSKVRKIKKKKFPSNFESLNASRTLFIYEGEQKKWNFYYRELFFLTFKGGYILKYAKNILKKILIFCV